MPVLAGFNSGEIRSLTPLAPPVPASAAVYESTIRDRYGDLADAFLKLYPSRQSQGEHLRDDARRALRLDRRATRAQAGRAGRAVVSLPVGPRLSRGRRGRAARLPCQRASLRVRHLRRHAAALAEECRTRARRRARRCDGRLLDELARTGRPSAAGPTAVAGLRQQRAYMAFEDGPQAKPRLCRACTSSTRRWSAGGAQRVVSDGTGTSGSSRRPCPPTCRHAGNRRAFEVRFELDWTTGQTVNRIPERRRENMASGPRA